MTPYKNSSQSKKEQISQMFNNISRNYDTCNRIISLGADKKWRKKIVKIVSKKKPKMILDIATGTGDLAMLLYKLNPLKIKALDISKGMLSVAKEKIKKAKMQNIIEFVLGDSEKMPFENAYFDVVTVAFGVRNFENLEQGLQEIKRILKPKGLLVILETSVPEKFPFKQGYQFYTKYFLPFFGKIFSKDKNAYEYLSKSAKAFPCGKAFLGILEKNGFSKTKNLPQTFGVATIYTAENS